MFEIITDVIYTLGLTLGVGSSTFALIFYIRALEDGVIDDSEKRFLHTVFVVLRIGMILIFIGLVLFLFTSTPQPLAQWFLLGVITLNAILMQMRKMPMKFGPVIAGGSWYSLFFVSRTPIVTLEPIILAATYLCFLVIFYLVFSYLKKKFTVERPKS